MAYYMVTYGREKEPHKFVFIAEDYYSALALCNLNIDDFITMEEVVKIDENEDGIPIFDRPTYH